MGWKLCLECAGDYITAYILQTHQTVHLKGGIILCKLYIKINKIVGPAVGIGKYRREEA